MCYKQHVKLSIFTSLCKGTFGNSLFSGSHNLQLIFWKCTSQFYKNVLVPRCKLLEYLQQRFRQFGANHKTN